MYIDENGKQYVKIHLIKGCKHYLDGWYFEDEISRIDQNGPYETLEKAIEELNCYNKYCLNGGETICKITLAEETLSSNYDHNKMCKCGCELVSNDNCFKRMYDIHNLICPKC